MSFILFNNYPNANLASESDTTCTKSLSTPFSLSGSAPAVRSIVVHLYNCILYLPVRYCQCAARKLKNDFLGWQAASPTLWISATRNGLVRIMRNLMVREQAHIATVTATQSSMCSAKMKGKVSLPLHLLSLKTGDRRLWESHTWEDWVPTSCSFWCYLMCSLLCMCQSILTGTWDWHGIPSTLQSPTYSDRNLIGPLGILGILTNFRSESDQTTWNPRNSDQLPTNFQPDSKWILSEFQPNSKQIPSYRIVASWMLTTRLTTYKYNLIFHNFTEIIEMRR